MRSNSNTNIIYPQDEQLLQIAGSMLTTQEVINNSIENIRELEKITEFNSKTMKWFNGEMIKRWEDIKNDALEYLGELINRREYLNSCRREAL